MKDSEAFKSRYYLNTEELQKIYERDNELSKSFMENSVDRVYLFVDELKIIFVNKAVINFFSARTRINEKSMFGKTLVELFPEVKDSGMFNAVIHT
ncbi:MAG: hypothetical protein HQ553_12040 [Chloroflexi bacterium]|nr:hypothetical protein [Chloroflexota bacterium]